MCDMPCGAMGKGCASSTGQFVDCCRKAAGGGGRLIMRVIKALGITIGAAVCALSLAAGASAAPGGADRPFRGTATGLALYGAEGGGTDGLKNVFDCDEAADAEDPEERAFFQVTTFTTAHGTASHLGKVHLEFAHCPGYEGPVGGQLGIVAANGDVLYGEYEGMGEDGILVTFNPTTPARSSCELLNEVPCESTGRFAQATGSAWLFADAMPGDENDLFVPWPWWGSWKGSLSY